MRYLLATATAMLMGCGGGVASHDDMAAKPADLAEVQAVDMAGAAVADMASSPGLDMAQKVVADMATPPDMTAPPKSPTQGPCTHSSDCANFPPPSIVQNGGTSALCVQDSSKFSAPLCSAVTFIAQGQYVGMFATLPTWDAGQEVTTGYVYAADGSAMIDITKLVGTTLDFVAQSQAGFGFVIQPN
jgi:hypothetical protein